MLKVIIADDEARVCRLVQMLVDWDALDMRVVGTASNGVEALELVIKLVPDILITDMRMPGCDGLELIEKAKQAAPDLEIAIISGYAQFEYAQTALRHGVGGYLLKPIKKSALISTLEKLGNKCREHAASAEAMESLRKDIEKSHELLRYRLIGDLLQKRLDAPSREQLGDEYGFCVGDGLLQVFILKMDYDLDCFNGSSLGVIKKKAEEILGATVFPSCLAGMVQFHESAGFGIASYAPQNAGLVRRALRQCLNQLETQKPLFGPVEFTLAVGIAVGAAEKLPLSMEGARHAISERIVEGTGRMLEDAPPPSGIDQRRLLDKYNRSIGHAIDALAVDIADMAADELYSDARRVPDVRGKELMDLALSAGKLFAARLNINGKADALRELEERCWLSSSAPMLYASLRDFQRQHIQDAREQRESEAALPILIAKKYVQQHFREPITLEDVCAATGFSVSYFSSMFKKETGEGFSKYLTSARIGQAKNLLQGTALSVVEICGQVGYNDLKHFTRTFKKMTGMSPGQYRKLHR